LLGLGDVFTGLGWPGSTQVDYGKPSGYRVTLTWIGRQGRSFIDWQNFQGGW
jgi:hypothetical protein